MSTAFVFSVSPTCTLPARTTNLDVFPPNKSTFNQNEVVIYSCRQNYLLRGQPRVTCQSTGRWSNQAPTCEKPGVVFVPMYHGFKALHKKSKSLRNDHFPYELKKETSDYRRFISLPLFNSMQSYRFAVSFRRISRLGSTFTFCDDSKSRISVFK